MSYGDRNTGWGYYWKYCPYSTNHKNKYYDNNFAGNTNNPDIIALQAGPGLASDFSSVPTADHIKTSGQMRYKNYGGAAGWICWDDDCPYYITNNKRYIEI
jgi:hypothetical protein